MYYNTTNETGEQLAAYKDAAKTQQERVLLFFRSRPGELFTPSEVLRQVFSGRTPVTSVRRAITCLTNERKLRKTAYHDEGPLGRREHCWTFEPAEPVSRSDGNHGVAARG